MPLKVWFDVQQLYYLPQFEPVYQILKQNGCECLFLIYKGNSPDAIVDQFLAETELPVKVVTAEEAVVFYQSNPANWIVFGNNFDHLETLPTETKTALLYHGIGVKECYYGRGLSLFDVRFTEGQYRQAELVKRFPESTFIEAGFAKLDPLASTEGLHKSKLDLESLGLDSSKPTLLYAPTFYPSSIEVIGKCWPQKFMDCNIIIKPHFFSYTNKKYDAQRKLLKKWGEMDNVYLASPTELSLIPYMATADILISEASSALFEFAALDKPVIWLDFYKLRWSYRGPFKYRFEKRMDQTILQYRDVGRHVSKPEELESAIRAELESPEANQKNRNQTTTELIGELDGCVANRISQYLIEKGLN